MKKIGPSFFAELKAADLVGLPFSWGDDGKIVCDQSMTAEQIEAVEAVYDAHDPSPLADAIVSAQAEIDSYYQVLFDRAVPNAAMKAEYDAAYMLAKDWLDDTAEPCPERLVALAEIHNITNEQAAAVVISKWIEAQASALNLRGAARLRAKAAIRLAANLEEVEAALVAGKAAMEAITYTV